MTIGQRIEEYFRSLEINQSDIAKAILVASSVALVVSAFGVFKMTEMKEDFDSFEDSSAALSQSVNSRQFNQTIDALRDVGTGGISSDMRRAAAALETYQEARNSIAGASETAENTAQVFRWLFLISVLGEVAGLTLLYM